MEGLGDDIDDLVVIETIYRCKLCTEPFNSKEAIISHVKQGCPISTKDDADESVKTSSTPKRQKRSKWKFKQEQEDPEYTPVLCKQEPDNSGNRRTGRKRKLTEKMQEFSKESELKLTKVTKSTANTITDSKDKSKDNSNRSPGRSNVNNQSKETESFAATSKDSNEVETIESDKNADENMETNTGEDKTETIQMQAKKLIEEAEKLLDNKENVKSLSGEMHPAEAEENPEVNENMEHTEEVQFLSETNIEDEKGDNSLLKVMQLGPRKRGRPKGSTSAVKKGHDGACPSCPAAFDTPYQCLIHMENEHGNYVLSWNTTIKSIQKQVKEKCAELEGEDSEDEHVVKEETVELAEEETQEPQSADRESDDKNEEKKEEKEIKPEPKITVKPVKKKRGRMPCPVCQHEYRASHIYRHLFRMHILKSFEPVKPKPKSVPKPTLCDVCGKSFKYPQNMKIHKMKLHLGIPHPYRKVPPSERPKLTFTCEICGYMACEKRRLNYHIMAFHENKIPFKCEHCDYQTWERTAIRDHRYRHQKEKPHKCSFCTYQCIQKPMLRAHMLRHHNVILPKSTHSNKPRWKELEQARLEMEGKLAATETEAVDVKQEKSKKVADIPGIGNITLIEGDEQEIVVNNMQPATVEAIDSLLQMHSADLSMHSYSQPTSNQTPQIIALTQGGTEGTIETAILVDGGQETTNTEQAVDIGAAFEIIKEDTVPGDAQAASTSQVLTLEPVESIETGENSSRVFFAPDEERKTDSEGPLKVYVSSNNKEGLTMQDLQNVCLQLGESLNQYGSREIVLVMSEQEATQ